MDKMSFYLCVEQGRDMLYRPAICLSTGREMWYIFNDALGICFRRKVDNQVTDLPVEEMRQKHMGVYRLMSAKWNAVSAILKEAPQA